MIRFLLNSRWYRVVIPSFLLLLCYFEHNNLIEAEIFFANQRRYTLDVINEVDEPICTFALPWSMVRMAMPPGAFVIELNTHVWLAHAPVISLCCWIFALRLANHLVHALVEILLPVLWSKPKPLFDKYYPRYLDRSWFYSSRVPLFSCYWYICKWFNRSH